MGNAGDAAGIVRHDLTFISISPRGGLYQRTVLIGQLDRQPVQFQHQQNKLIPDEVQKGGAALLFVQRKQRNAVDGFGQFTDRGIAHGLRRGICHLDSRDLLQPGKLVKEFVILLVADGRRIEVIILVTAPIQALGQSYHLFISGLCH